MIVVKKKNIIEKKTKIAEVSFILYLKQLVQTMLNIKFVVSDCDVNICFVITVGEAVGEEFVAIIVVAEVFIGEVIITEFVVAVIVVSVIVVAVAFVAADVVVEVVVVVIVVAVAVVAESFGAELVTEIFNDEADVVVGFSIVDDVDVARVMKCCM